MPNANTTTILVATTGLTYRVRLEEFLDFVGLLVRGEGGQAADHAAQLELTTEPLHQLLPTRLGCSEWTADTTHTTGVNMMAGITCASTWQQGRVYLNEFPAQLSTLAVVNHAAHHHEHILRAHIGGQGEVQSAAHTAEGSTEK